jgi:hypothetical protein
MTKDVGWTLGNGAKGTLLTAAIAANSEIKTIFSDKKALLQRDSVFELIEKSDRQVKCLSLSFNSNFVDST